MTREQAIELLRAVAPKHVKTYGYLPANETFAQSWMPPAWAIEAVLKASEPPEQPESFIDRLFVEGNELGARIDKLQEFKLGDVWPTLTDDVRTLMDRQLAAMIEYHEVLAARINVLTAPA